VTVVENFVHAYRRRMNQSIAESRRFALTGQADQHNKALVRETQPFMVVRCHRERASLEQCQPFSLLRVSWVDKKMVDVTRPHNECRCDVKPSRACSAGSVHAVGPMRHGGPCPVLLHFLL
jgi:hypothetical protein